MGSMDKPTALMTRFKLSVQQVADLSGIPVAELQAVLAGGKRSHHREGTRSSPLGAPKNR
jgi:hypothetical protein